MGFTVVDELIEETLSVLHERHELYGDSTENHTRLAQAWAGFLNTQVSTWDALLMMVINKAIRLRMNPHHHDSWVDLLGYVLLAWQAWCEREKKSEEEDHERD